MINGVIICSLSLAHHSFYILLNASTKANHAVDLQFSCNSRCFFVYIDDSKFELMARLFLLERSTKFHREKSISTPDMVQILENIYTRNNSQTVVAMSIVGHTLFIRVSSSSLRELYISYVNGDRNSSFVWMDQVSLIYFHSPSCFTSPFSL